MAGKAETMFDMTAYAAFKNRLDDLGAVEGELLPNERETYRSLALKYAEPATPDATDAVCLDVILRNVAIRKGYDFDAKTDGGRVIELPHARRSGEA